MVQRFQQACQQLRLAGELTETFGGSDQNPLSQHGIQGIVLSNGMYKMHTTSEYTRVEDLWQGSRLVEALHKEVVYGKKSPRKLSAILCCTVWIVTIWRDGRVDDILNRGGAG